MKSTAHTDDIYRVIHTEHHDPFSVLGAHIVKAEGKPAVAVRAFQPDAKEMYVVENTDNGNVYKMVKIKEDGFYEAVIKNHSEVFPYKFKRISNDGSEEIIYDPYSFLPTLTDLDLYLFNAGDHHRIYDKLGAHAIEVTGIKGVQFAVWAPNARSVSVVGSFNNWDRRRHAMRVLGASGVWEIFVPELSVGEIYKFQVKTKSGSCAGQNGSVRD